MLPFMGDELLRGDQVKLVPTIREDMPEFARWAQDIEGQRLLRRGRRPSRVAHRLHRHRR